MKLIQQLLSTALLLVLMFGCAVTKGGKGGGGSKDSLVSINTRFGEILVVVFPETPAHRKNFLKLSSEKFYDSTSFHRIIRNFMIQGGDPNSKDNNPGNDGQGGPGYTLPAEFNPAFLHNQGAVAAARMGDMVNPKKESSGSQFYIVDGPDGSHHLDQNYTVFGQVVKGIEVVQTIANQPKGPGDRPNNNVKMWVKVIPMKKEQVTAMYGYDYASHTIKPELKKEKK